MPSNIHKDKLSKEYAFYSVKERAWWDGGQISDVYEDSRTVMQKSHLDFAVAMEPNIRRFPSGKEEMSTDSYYTYRTDTEVVLGDHVSADYNIVQNKDAFSFFDEIAKEHDLQYETAGALGKGERIFITAKFKDHILVGKDDMIEKYLFLTMSHDGKRSITAAFTPIRIVCNNTLNAALEDCTNMIKIKHTDDVQSKLKQGRLLMQLANDSSKRMEETFNRWTKINMDDKDLQRLIHIAMASDKETLDCVRDCRIEEASPRYKNQIYGAYGYAMMADSQKMETTKGKLFGAYNAITGYFQNVRSYADNEQKLESIIYGGLAQKKAQATIELCENYAKYGTDALMLN